MSSPAGVLSVGEYALSNLGFHVDASREFGGQFDIIRDAKPVAGLFLMNKNEPGKSAPAINACRFAVIRFMDAEDALSGSDTPGANASANMLRAFNMIRPFLAVYPNAYWAYPRNEIGDWSLAALYDAEMVEWVRLLKESGAKAAIGCFSFGTPDYPIWPKFEKALRAAREAGGLLNLHEYGVNDMRVSGFDAITGLRHHCLRYRTLWAKYPSLPWPQIFIGECGLDADINFPVGSPQRGGAWRNIGVSPEQYLEQLIWYDTEIAKDGVIGAIYHWDANDDAYDIVKRRGDMHYVAFDIINRIKISSPVLKPLPPIPAPSPTPAPQPAPTPKAGRYHVTSAINVRTGPGREYAIAGYAFKTAPVDIESIADKPDVEGIVWGKMAGQNWYLSMRYLAAG